MKIALCGLGKMGLNLVKNLIDNEHDVIAFDIDGQAVREAEKAGAVGVESLEKLVKAFSGDRKVIWMMVPAGDITENLIKELTPLLDKQDILMDGGNAFYKDSIRRAAELKTKGIQYIDIGTSGGMEGARHGACTMVGGQKDIVENIEAVFQDVSVDDGYLYTGEAGSGHFLKMVHNGVEYGMMQAIGEGFDILEKSHFDYDHEKVAKVWNNGSVIRSWLMELMESAFSEDPRLDDIKGVVQASGEGKWTVETAMELETAAPVIAMSLMMRNRSLESDTFSGKVVASLRNQFGGHSVENS